ncbi:hypothetical protein B566_EDAN014481 [Ephemera danica]|nr:hypothetical protein B566_EDAN014481 [Ephemera danica]
MVALISHTVYELNRCNARPHRSTMPRVERPHRLLGLSMLAATLVLQRELEAKFGLSGLTAATSPPEAAAQVQLQPRLLSPPEDTLGLGLVARSILGVPAATSRALPAVDTRVNEVLSSSSSSSSTTTSSPRRALAPSVEDNSIKYKDRYDFLSIDHVLKSPRLMHNFHQCVMERGPCTSEAAELRRIIPEAMRSECARCTERQRQQAGRVLAFIIEHRPEWLRELFEKFDPDGSIRKKYDIEVDFPEVEAQ